MPVPFCEAQCLCHSARRNACAILRVAMPAPSSRALASQAFEMAIEQNIFFVTTKKVLGLWAWFDEKLIRAQEVHARSLAA